MIEMGKNEIWKLFEFISMGEVWSTTYFDKIYML